MALDISKLKGVIPDDVYDNLVKTAMTAYTIDSYLKVAHFLAQCNYESGNFKKVEENLNYTAERLIKVFPKYFTTANAGAYAGNPEMIASRVYASRFGNGDEASKDGYKFRGRGYIQLTFKANYEEFGKKLKVDLVANPEKVATTYPLESACFYFKMKKLFAKSEEGHEETVVTDITKIVSGSTETAAKRFKLFDNYYNLLVPPNPKVEANPMVKTKAKRTKKKKKKDSK